MMSETVTVNGITKPCASLSNTEWLTDAHTAECGMELVIAHPDGEVTRHEIIDTTAGYITTSNGISYAAQRINNSNRMVVE